MGPRFNGQKISVVKEKFRKFFLFAKKKWRKHSTNYIVQFLTCLIEIQFGSCRKFICIFVTCFSDVYKLLNVHYNYILFILIHYNNILTHPVHCKLLLIYVFRIHSI